MLNKKNILEMSKELENQIIKQENKKKNFLNTYGNIIYNRIFLTSIFILYLSFAIYFVKNISGNIGILGYSIIIILILTKIIYFLISLFKILIENTLFLYLFFIIYFILSLISIGIFYLYNFKLAIEFALLDLFLLLLIGGFYKIFIID